MRARLHAKRRVLWGGVAVLGALACSKGASPTAVLPDAATAASDTDIDRAEDLRRPGDIPADAQRRDPATRRRAARAFARIREADDAALLRALEDDDDDTVAWAGYGLGESCKGREVIHVRALAARLASLDPRLPRGLLNPRATILRALGRCGGDLAEETLRAWLRRGEAAQTIDEAAAYALGDLAAKRGSLSAETAAALLDAAERKSPLDPALYPFGRADDWAGGGLEPRLVAAARAALARPGPSRVFAIRALGRSGEGNAAAELEGVLSSADFSAAERAEAAHALGRLQKGGQAALARSLSSMLAGGLLAMEDGMVGVLLATLGALGDDVPTGVWPSLWAMARADPLLGPGAARARRASVLRCAAAQKLARGAWDSDILGACDVADGEAGERARLAAIDHGPLVKARRAAWLDLARQTKHVRVREAAIEAIARHPELGDLALVLLAEALTAKDPGLVATSASVIAAHPERVYVLADREKRAALDPRSPPPTGHAARELAPRIAEALRAAIAQPRTEDLVETRAALIDAALAVGLDEGRDQAQAACHDRNVTIRARAAKALAAVGQASSCPAPDAGGDSAPEVGHAISRPVRVDFQTEAGALAITFDPLFAPIAATRFVALARSGFYTGVAVHRVVPGFVVQFGDRGGDGYGGSGRLLRCETSPVAFGALDVGVALAGRDTGSSQLFVSLARYPHLDGQYAWVGHAEGEWGALVEGDTVQAVRVEE